MAFVARGDLWTAPRDGGNAQRLVQSKGHILAPRFSPNGQWIAYTERRARGQDVFAVAAAGGPPRRLTFDARGLPQDNLVVAWTPDSKNVVFLSDRGAWADKVLRAFLVPIEGGMATPLPLTEAGELSYAADGSAIAYNRTFTAFMARKRYTGGEAPDIWIYDGKSRQSRRLTSWKGTSDAPLWWEQRIYFRSDQGRGFRQNLWCYELDDRSMRQITHFGNYDIDVPTLGANRISFQQGGRLWALDLPSERLHEISARVADDGRRTAVFTSDASEELRDTDVTGAVDIRLSPGGDAVFGSAHGDVFRHALPTGGAKNLTSTPRIQEENPSPSPDGRWIAYVTEANGAEQIALRPSAGGRERLLTHLASGVFYTPGWSPRGDRLVVADAEHDLWLVSVDGERKPEIIFHDVVAEIRDASFSSDGRWLAYSTTRDTAQRAIHLHEIATGHDTVVSSPLESDRNPVFSDDGTTLYFLSQRNEAPFTSDRGDEATVSLLKSDGVYAAALRSPGTTPEDLSRPIDAADLMTRAVALPVMPARIVSLEVSKDLVIYETRPPALIGGEMAGEVAALHAYDPKTHRDQVLVSDLDLHVLSADGRHVLFKRHGTWRYIDTAPGSTEKDVQLGGLSLQVDPRAEWAEMFERAWRLDRDLFFSRVMNGNDWQAVYDAYAPLVKYVGSHDDMLYLLRELQGELATSHAFIGGADPDDREPRVRTPRLGADLTLDTATGRYRIQHIYHGDATRDRFRSPMANQSVDAGDYLLAINGRELVAPADPDSLLAGQQGFLTLTVASAPSGARRELQITPLRDDVDLRQYDWVEANRRKVAQLSSGKLGYLFVPDFDALGSQDFARQFQGQLDKQGLIFDVRWNEGGFTSQAVLDVLRRLQAGVFVNREGALAPLPLFVAPRAMVALVNAKTGSDGDQFAYYFRAYGLGPVVGERTWGGVQGIKGPWRLMDGTFITIPKDSLASVDGHWLIENEGVSPDVLSLPEPDEAMTGHDRQLEDAVTAAMVEVGKHAAGTPSAPPPLPAYPSGGDVPGTTMRKDD